MSRSNTKASSQATQQQTTEPTTDPTTDPTTEPTTEPTGGGTPQAPETEPAAADTETVAGNPSTTTLDSHLDKPSTTAPGDGPADTTDPTEQASSASPDKAAAALAGHGTVNAVVKVGEGAVDPEVTEGRTERYEATRPDGTKVTVVHDLDTGATRVDAEDQQADQADGA